MKTVTIVPWGTYTKVGEKGAFGCMLLTQDDDKRINGCYSNSTANRMELIGLIRALEEIESLYPNEVCKIELVSKLNYLTMPLSSGKLADNVRCGDGLINFDLWKRVHDLGKNHIWSVVKIKTGIVERYHKMAVTLAHEAFSNYEGINDEGSRYSSRKRLPKASPVFELHEIKHNEDDIEYPHEISSDSIEASNDNEIYNSHENAI